MTMDTTTFQAPQRPRRRFLTHPAFYQYRQLATLVALGNLAVFAYGLAQGWWWGVDGPALNSLADMALINFALGILIRQQYVVNFLFWLATRIPTSWPLQIRWIAGKVFHFGGLHSGGTVAGSVWLTAFTAGAVWLALTGRGVSDLTLGASIALLVLLTAMILTSIGPWRQRRHDLFERTHRFGGWTALLVLWVQSVSFTRDMGQPLLEAPVFWVLCLITFSIALPWLRLKKVPVEIVKPSDHAVVAKFNYGDDAFPGSSNALSLNPLLEWHSFASIPTPGEPGYRLIISRAGDWTGEFIDRCPSHVWVKGITTSGVARIEVLFKRVVYIATGSGIGPVLPHLLAQDVPIHLIWATRNPRKTYGDALCDEILDACPDAHIWDTDAKGKPDLGAMALAAVRSFDAEAVIVISNPKLSWYVVDACEKEGVPAFSAIWDS